jgi:hypothetical protein
VVLVPHPLLAEAQLALASALHDLGRDEQAICSAAQSLAVARRGGYRLVEGTALTMLARLQLRRSSRAAVATAERALRIHRHTQHRPGAADALAVLVAADCPVPAALSPVDRVPHREDRVPHRETVN